MRIISAKILTITFLLISATASVFGQTSYFIKGTVVDEAGNAVVGAEVSIARSFGGFDTKTMSDNAGVFTASVPAGRYEIVVKASTFAPERRDVVISSNEILTIVLRPEALAAVVSVSSSYLVGTAESLSEVPGSVERLDALTLQKSRVFNFSEALRKIAGVNVRDEEGFGLRPNIGVRGTNPTRSTKVLLLEDGVPLTFAPYGDNASYYHPPIERFESIEVLKGSGQIAYGPQTIAGIINYLTPNPPYKPSATINLEGGNRRYFNGTASGGATFGNLGLLTSFMLKRGEGAKQNTFFKLNDSANKAVYNLNDRNTITAKFSFYKEDSDLTYTGATEAEFAADPRGNIFKNDFFYGRRYGFSLQHAAVLMPKISLVSNFYANYFSRDWWRQTSNSGERPFRLFRPNDPNNPISDADCLSLADLNTTCGNRGNLRDYRTVGVEPRLTANFSTGGIRNELNVGFRVHFEEQDRRSKYGDLPNSRDGYLAEDNERKTKAYSGFIQHRLIWKRLAVTPGIRMEQIEYQRTNRLVAGGPTGETSLFEAVPGIGFSYAGLKRTTVFAGVHRGFAPPRVEDVITNSGGVIDLDSELSWNYEAGVRTSPFEGVNLSATFFRNDYENQIVASSIAGGTAFTNGGQTLQQGFEFSGSLDTGTILNSKHSLYLRSALTYLPIAEFRGVRFSSITNANVLTRLCPSNRLVASTRCLITGNRLPYVPTTELTTSLGYSHSSGLDAFIENVFIGRQYGDDLMSVNPEPNGQIGAIPAQTYWNGTINYRVENWKTTLFVTAKNIFDRTFIVDRSRGILPSQGRLIQAGVSIRF